MRHIRRSTALLLWLLLGASAAVFAAEPPEIEWISAGREGEPVVHLFFFWTPTCPHCRRARPFVDGLAEEHPWLEVRSLPLIADDAHVSLYVEMARALGREPRSVPAFLFCAQMWVGYDNAETTGRLLEQALVDCRARGLANAPPAMPPVERSAAEHIELPVVGALDPSHARHGYRATSRGPADGLTQSLNHSLSLTRGAQILSPSEAIGDRRRPARPRRCGQPSPCPAQGTIAATRTWSLKADVAGPWSKVGGVASSSSRSAFSPSK